MTRIYRSLLVEGKEPPTYEVGEGVVRLRFAASNLSPQFRLFVSEEEELGRLMTVDQLLIIQCLMRHGTIDLSQASKVSQRPENRASETLHELERRGYVLAESARLWRMSLGLRDRLGQSTTDAERGRVFDRSADAVRSRLMRGESLSNAEIRTITGLSRGQAKKLMEKLRIVGDAEVSGLGRGARWRSPTNGDHGGAVSLRNGA